MNVKLGKFKIVYLILPGIIALLGAAVGALFVGYYLIDMIGSISLSASGSSQNQTASLIFREPKKVVVENNEMISSIVDTATKSYLGIYKKIENSAEETENNNSKFVRSNYYDLLSPSGVGFVLTSDGWLISIFHPEKNVQYVAISKDKKIYEVEKFIEDEKTGFTFINIKAKDLTVKSFSGADDIKNGQSVLAINWNKESWLSSITGQGAPSQQIKSSDNYSPQLNINNILPKEFYGMAMYSLSGSCVGLVDSTGRVEPISVFSGPIRSLLKSGEIIRPSLGLNYFNLSSLVDPDSSDTNLLGALVGGNATTKAIIKNGPAERSGLKEGDIITAIDNEKITQENDLDEIISKYAAGDSVIVEYQRNKESFLADVVLGKF